MRKHIKSIYLIVIVLAILATACKKPSSFTYPPSKGSAYDIINTDANFSYFKYIVDKAGLTATLQSSDAYTVFVPTNTAFVNAGYPLTLLQNMSVADVTTLVNYNIVKGAIDVNTITSSQKLTNLDNQTITVQSKFGHLFVDGGDITNPSEVTTGGFVNDINKVLTSGTNLLSVITNYNNATTNSQLTYLAAAITRASTGSTNFTSLLTGTTPYTFFAPNNGAFIDAGYATIAAVNAATPDVLGNLLKYQLMPGVNLTTAFDSVAVTSYNGTPIYFNNKYVTRTTYWYANGISFGNNLPSNLLAANGVLHTIPRMLPTPVTTNTLARINSDATLTMFYALIQRASTGGTNFAGILSATSPAYTVFAINNAGLQAAGYANVAAVTAENPAILASILQLHMVPGRVNNISVGSGTVTTLLNTSTTGIPSYDPINFITSGTAFSVQGPTNTAAIPVLTPNNVVTTNGILNIIGSEMKP